MPQVEMIHGPLDGCELYVDRDVRRIFYAPPRNENCSYATYCAKGDENEVPEWDRNRLTGRYFRPAQNPNEAFWKPYGEEGAPS